MQYASNLHRSTFGAPTLWGNRETWSVYSSHLSRSTPPICIAIRLPFVSQYFWKIWAPPFCWTEFPKKVAKFETKFPKFSPRFAPKFAPKCQNFPTFPARPKSPPPNFTSFSHRLQISNRIPNQISPKMSQTHFCRLGSPKKILVVVVTGMFPIQQIRWEHCNRLETQATPSNPHHLSLYQSGPGSVRFGYGLGMERFERFRFSVPAVPLRRGVFLCFSTISQRGRFRFRFRFLENGSGGAFGSWENGSDGSGFRFRFGSWATLLYWVPCDRKSFHYSKDRGAKKPININNFAGLSRKWVGVKLFMRFPFPGEKRKHINKIPRKSEEKAGTVPGQSGENCVFVFSCLLVFSRP